MLVKKTTYLQHEKLKVSSETFLTLLYSILEGERETEVKLPPEPADGT